MENTKDLFESIEEQSPEIQAIVERMEEQHASDGVGYDDLANYVKEAEKVGYTFQFGLSAEPYNLQKLPGGKIICKNDSPPITTRSYDWVASRENWDLNDPIGYGSTEDQSINELLELEKNISS